MSSSPVSENDEAGVEQYSASWQAIMQLVRKGASWSGYERNCCFLNMSGEFSVASHVSGLDYPDDGRGMAVTDWDQDGDLDLWFRNRTAPRLRLMLNQASNQGSRRSVAFRLTGTTSNRDAIGAIVELEVDGTERRFIRSVNAGDMFLSQSSKWVHFGFPDDAIVKSVKVLWPGGERSRFSGIEAGKRYFLEQGKSMAVSAKNPRVVTLESTPLETENASTGFASIVLPAPIPLPIDSYSDEEGIEVALEVTTNVRLLVLWSSSCPHCKQELTRLAKSPSGLDVLALCVDGNSRETRNAAKALVSETEFSGVWGMIGAGALERVQVLQEALFDKTPDFAVPLAFLLRPGNAIVALYRGALSDAALSYDVKTVAAASDAELRNLAPPFPGRWFTKPATPTFLPRMIARRIQARYPEDAIAYLHLAAEHSAGSEKQNLIAELGRKHYGLARKLVAKQETQDAEFHFRKSLEANPNVAALHNDLGTVLAQMGRMEEAEKHFAEAIRLQPDYPLAEKNRARAKQLLLRSDL